jgi:hypothetical protein
MFAVIIVESFFIIFTFAGNVILSDFKFNQASVQLTSSAVSISLPLSGGLVVSQEVKITIIKKTSAINMIIFCCFIVMLLL